MDAVFETPNKSLVRLFTAYMHRAYRMKGRSPSPFGTYYEFGTGWGGTLASFMLAAERCAADFKLGAKDFRVFAFDSFEGLPPSSHPADNHGNWKPGAFANSVDIIKGKMATHPFAKDVKVDYVKGYFENSLTNDLMSKVRLFPLAS
jgi:hypothetical protein